ncbi:Phage minor tail protein U [Gallibacterium anatis UMN179]|uniref:Phage minor tail protein U n=1 Tax=Gallibacterium anatis (strain UMN179) TaxID=1005058 RepID=F4H9F6_GALAU|nr:phage tail terminator protein [Gallibacterium anatis]AEC18409.1 Phage minor tail protein U [Gallibacterium anatis UMN179]
MLIHKAIREQIAELLQSLDPTIKVWAGRPTFIDLDNEPTTLAVFIDDAQSEPTGLCGGEWEAILNIAIYQRSTQGEAPLDELAEQIIQCLAEAFEDDELDTLQQCYLTGYHYEQDAQKRTWYIANLQYQITYGQEE